jgi:hypothetical protein
MSGNAGRGLPRLQSLPGWVKVRRAAAETHFCLRFRDCVIAFGGPAAGRARFYSHLPLRSRMLNINQRHFEISRAALF